MLALVIIQMTLLVSCSPLTFFFLVCCPSLHEKSPRKKRASVPQITAFIYEEIWQKGNKEHILNLKVKSQGGCCNTL
uniref:Uncharacterized protein n=1 Tax=Aegilops tauschii subsp. strangulata TaxID=200361 RepID=A0A453LQ38_AEGTS